MIWIRISMDLIWIRISMDLILKNINGQEYEWIGMTFIKMPNKFNSQEQAVLHRPKAFTSKKLLKSIELRNCELPTLYLPRLKHLQKKILPLDDVMLIRKQLSKHLTFKKQDISCVNSSYFQELSEPVKAVPYSSATYQVNLQLVNQIFAACDFNLKEKDILVLEGQQTQSKFIFFTKFQYHPLSICCASPTVIKNYDLSPLFKNHKGRDYHNPQNTFIKCDFLCLNCRNQILKFSNMEGTESEYDKKKRLVDFGLMIASGRYKKIRINQDSLNASQSMSRGSLLKQSIVRYHLKSSLS